MCYLRTKIKKLFKIFLKKLNIASHKQSFGFFKAILEAFFLKKLGNSPLFPAHFEEKSIPKYLLNNLERKFKQLLKDSDCMGFWELLLIAVGLSMDALAVSIGKGLSVQNIKMHHTAKVGLWFGGFQALMPLVGYYLGASFASVVAEVDHWIAFALLAIIGFNMIKESFAKDEACGCNDFSVRKMFLLAVATSIDALAVGVTFAFLGVEILPAILLIGLTTFVLSAVGLHIGNAFGCRYKSKAEFAGGAILILIGTKILLEHLLG